MKRILIAGFILSFGILNAQTDFRPGYVIKNTGDTIYGQIDYRGDLLMSSICRFKNPEMETTVYFPDDLYAFQFIDGKYYISKEVGIKRVFLEYLVKGIVSIYYTRDEEGDHYYLDKAGEVLTELPYTEKVKHIENKDVLYESNKHMGILYYYMQDAPDFQSRIKAIRIPDHNSLIKLAEDYHNTVCNDEECIIYEKKVSLINISVEPFAGLTWYKDQEKFVYEYGSYLYVWVPRASEKLFFKTGIAYNQITEDETNLNIFKVPFQFQYIYRAHKIQPHISGGVNFIAAKHGSARNFSHTIGLDAGLNYQVSDKISICAAINSDCLPFIFVLLPDGRIALVGYASILGVRIDL